MSEVTVVGAGFSGLTLAYYLNRYGLRVTVVEKDSRPGGLISTQNTEYGLVETAANALLCNAEIEKLFADLELGFAYQPRERKNRYIFWKKPRRWPLSLWTTFKLVKLMIMTRLGFKGFQPLPRESVQAWARRMIGIEFEERLLTPALQGVYAGNVSRMSAALIVTKLFGKSKVTRGKRRGSVAPLHGMGELMTNLRTKLAASGVEFQFGKDFMISEALKAPVVLCTSAWAAEKIVRGSYPKLADTLKRCESLPLISVTAFFEPTKSDRKGFGCLFPKAQGFQALGVLFNASIFSGRSSKRSETWIYGGAGRAEIMQLDDVEILKHLGSDREKLTKRMQPPLAATITRWPQALPHYTVEWEQALKEMHVERPLFMHGNYLGALGLSEIHQRSHDLAQQIRDLYVS